MKKTTVGRAELRVLEYVSEHRPVSVGEVARHFARTAGTARTTVLTVMERLRKKGYLTRKKDQGVWRYSTKLGTAELRKSLVRDFVERTLGDSLSPFMAYLAQDAELTEQELAQLKQTVRSLEARRRRKT